MTTIQAQGATASPRPHWGPTEHPTRLGAWDRRSTVVPTFLTVAGAGAGLLGGAWAARSAVGHLVSGGGRLGGIATVLGATAGAALCGFGTVKLIGALSPTDPYPETATPYAGVVDARRHWSLDQVIGQPVAELTEHEDGAPAAKITATRDSRDGNWGKFDNAVRAARSRLQGGEHPQAVGIFAIDRHITSLYDLADLEVDADVDFAALDVAFTDPSLVAIATPSGLYKRDGVHTR